MSIFLRQTIDEWGEVNYSLTTAGYTALVVLMILLLLAGCAIFGIKSHFSTKQIAFSAMAVALAMVTSLVELIHFPMGGAVTLFSMMFITIIGYWYGLGVGLSTAVAYGVLQLLVDPYILSLPQMLCDYIFAFGALGLSGLWSKKDGKFSIIFAYLTGVLGRFFFSFLSGWIFFGMYAGEYGFSSAPLYSFCYNGAYIGTEAAMTVVLLMIPAVRQALMQVKGMANNQNISE